MKEVQKSNFVQVFMKKKMNFIDSSIGKFPFHLKGFLDMQMLSVHKVN